MLLTTHSWEISPGNLSWLPPDSVSRIVHITTNMWLTGRYGEPRSTLILIIYFHVTQPHENVSLSIVLSNHWSSTQLWKLKGELTWESIKCILTIDYWDKIVGFMHFRQRYKPVIAIANRLLNISDVIQQKLPPNIDNQAHVFPDIICT